MRSIFISLLISTSFLVHATGDSWKQILRKKEGKVTFYWFPNNVNISDSKDVIDGVEHDLAFAFIRYLNEKYDLAIEVEWIETESFDTVMETVRYGKGGVFGASSISITEDRMRDLSFTPAYLADIAVLVSSPRIPIAHSPDDFKSIFNHKSAITIANTTLYDALTELRDQLEIEMNIDYVSNSGEIIESIENRGDAFGYIDLPNFLVSVQNASKIRRQFFYPIKLRGLAMIYPKDSDWKEAVDDYFTSAQFEADKEAIIQRYFGEDITDIFDRISRSAEIGPFEEIMISNREKELQYEELLEATQREKVSDRTTAILIAVLAFVGFGLFLLVVSNKIKTQSNKKLQEQQSMIAERNEQLKQLNEEKNDLIKVLAHDLRSPLSNIITSSMLLKERVKLDDTDAQMLGFISQSSEKIQSMITKILDVEAIDSGERNMKMEVISVSEIVDQVIKDNAARAEKKGIKLLKEGEAELLAAADKFYLSQVVENLVSNAIKFSDSGSSITIILSKEGDKSRITVKDEGPGFSSEDQKNIFKKFHKLSAQPTGGEETVGLGLSIVKAYTELMDGAISFDTEEGKGTSFYVDMNQSL